MGVLAITFVKKYLPETKDRTLEELEFYFRNYKQQSKNDKLEVEYKRSNA